MRKADFIVVGVFAALSLGLLAGAAALPAGVSGQPGPGFFPAVVALVMLTLSAALAWQTRRSTGETASAPPAEHLDIVGGVVLLTMAYLALWGTGWFALRTAIYLSLLLRVVGQAWPRSYVVGAVLSLIVTVAFRYGLRVSLE